MEDVAARQLARKLADGELLEAYGARRLLEDAQRRAAARGAYRRFAEIAPNISYVIDTNLQQGSPAVGARHIAALGQAGLWPHVSAVEIGNECDHWPAAQQLSFAAYESRFGAFAAAYAAAGMPARMLQGA